MSTKKHWIPVAVDTGDGGKLFWDEPSGMLSWLDNGEILGFDHRPHCVGDLEALPGFEVLPHAPWIRRTTATVDRGLAALKAIRDEMFGWGDEDVTAVNLWKVIQWAIQEAEAK